MKKLLIVGASILFSAMPAIAQVQSVTTSDKNGVMKTTEILKSGKNLEKVTCRDFNDLDESFKPQAVTYASNYGPKGKAHPTMTVTGVETITPVVITDCSAQPDNKLVSTVNAAKKKTAG